MLFCCCYLVLKSSYFNISNRHSNFINVIHYNVYVQSYLYIQPLGTQFQSNYKGYTHVHPITRSTKQNKLLHILHSQHTVLEAPLPTSIILSHRQPSQQSIEHETLVRWTCNLREPVGTCGRSNKPVDTFTYVTTRVLLQSFVG